MKFTLVAVMALGAAAPAASFSYLESLSSPGTSIAPPKMAPPPVAPAQPASSSEAPFFFTNGAKDEPADSPAFFFTNGNTDVPAPASSANYLQHLSTGATSVSGPGVPSYLDALPKNSGAAGGPGISSYASSLNQAAASIAPPAPAVAAPAPAAPTDFSDAPAPVVVSTGNYLDALAGGSSSMSGGPGISSYLDALPKSASLAGGAGISTYISAMTSTNVVNGPGITSYTDALSGSSAGYGSKTYSPFGGSSTGAAKSSKPAFAFGSVTGRFDFSLEADAALIEQLKAARGRRVRLTGRVTSISS
jgi:hypothetical protein